MGIPGPKPKRKNIEWSENVAYALGLIASDGSLSINGRHIDLTSKDREQLLNFMKCIDKEITISEKKSKYGPEPILRAQFSDVVLYNFLYSIGLTPRKSLTIGALNVPDRFFFDFLRGIFDGDGCFYSYFDPRWKSSFMYYLQFGSSSKNHTDWLQASIERLCGVRGHRVHTGREGYKLYGLRYAKCESLVVIKRMYHKKSVVSLTRKKLKIQAALRIVGESLPKG